MSWQDSLIPLLRGQINDMVSPYTYSDGRLEELCVYSAHLILNEITFENTYTVTIPTLTISPDPSDDVAFLNLVSLKAAIMVVFNELKDYSTKSVKIVDGPSQIDLSTTYKNKKDLYDSLLKAFEKAKTLHALGDNGGVGGLGKAVITPTTIETQSPYIF